jgi:hypothetical protein
MSSIYNSYILPRTKWLIAISLSDKYSGMNIGVVIFVTCYLSVEVEVNFLNEHFVLQLLKNKLNLIPYFPRLIKMDRVGFEPTTSAHKQLMSSIVYFHSYPVILNFLDSGSNSDSSAIIRLFIQDNFCEFVNPVTMIKPLTFPPSTTLPFP